MRKLLEEKIQGLPHKPGVYMFRDATGVLLYVGKAVKLKSRVSSYFRRDAGQSSTRIQHMITQIADLDYTVTDNEVESLVLENNFIKQFQPKYNVRLRDDKNYLFLKINIHDQIPTIEYDRKPSDKSAEYFGPYTSSISVKDTLRLLRKVFPYCANVRVSAKPCFYYHIGKCPGVCFGKISLDDYKKNYIGKIIKFLEGKQIEILGDLKSEMKFYATHRQFEKAARVRDQVFALNRVLERQKLVYARKIDQDVFALHCESVAVVNLFIIREGKLIQKENFILENTRNVPQEEILEAFLAKYYLDATNLPKEILIPTTINTEELNQIFATQDKKIKISVPAKKEKLDLIKLGQENAKQYLEAQSDKHLLEEARLLSSLKELQRVLSLDQLPARMECFDISNIQGTNAVGSMVVFDFAHPKKDAYRKFKIQTKNTPDDFGMMREMLERRFKRSVQGERKTKGKQKENKAGSTSAVPFDIPSAIPSPFPPLWPLPNLVIIDGGKGQLSTAVSVLKQYKLQIPIIGLAKRLEEIFLPGKSMPIVLPDNSQALFLLQRIRDEAHRFAITYHRKLRSKSAVSSVLDQITGIGPAKKKKLLEKFGSATQLRKASLTDISSVVGAKAAEKIKASL